MDSVYDVIEALRRYNGYSLRDLAAKAGVSHTTISSLYSRHSTRMSIPLLAKIAQVFGVSWYELLGREAMSFGDNTPAENEKPVPKVSTALTPEIIRKILERLIGEGYERYLYGDTIRRNESVLYDGGVSHTNSMYMKRSIDIFLNKLNDEGLMEAMRHILDLAQDPRYCISSEPNNAENDKPY